MMLPKRLSPATWFKSCVVSLFAGMAMNCIAVHKANAAATITFVGVIRDRTDFKRLNIGKAGYWFPQFGAKNPVAGRPTGENARDALPLWIAPLNHVTSLLDPAFKTRTFSQDGPARSKGGQPKWNKFTLPDGKTGFSGAIVDPFARKNTNNTINRIQLRLRAGHFLLPRRDRQYQPGARSYDPASSAWQFKGSRLRGRLVSRNKRPGVQRHSRCLHVPLRRFCGWRLPQAAAQRRLARRRRAEFRGNHV